jgi:nitrite reductase/ring-hydroxylating ferredoxin subunit
MDAVDQKPLYVICRANHIDPGHAKSFSLARLTDTGEGRPFGIFIVRTSRDGFVGYVNVCPHDGSWLNFNSGEFFDDGRAHLKCGRHGALFDIQTGVCVEGPCQGAALQPVALIVEEGDLCLSGVELVEDDGLPNPFEEPDDTMEIMIHPD